MDGLKRPVFADVAEAGEVAPGEVKAVMADDHSILLLNVEGELYAFKNVCASDGMSLEGGRLTETVLVCPWQNCAYDARSGKRVDDPGQPALAVVPVRVEDGTVRVAVDAA
ncbi:MAG: Rieske 2Fe-2S domain-containing protein, partial [Actinomycetota bacterium]|nr:Rieske 2Fe-2S domain-containing protein [Actinomycetota bacterium]